MARHSSNRRKRGVFLSPAGWRRLQAAERQTEANGNQVLPYTLEALSEITGLSPNTITKVRRRQAAVDRQTLESYFEAFQLKLTPEDYQSTDALTEPTLRPDSVRGQLSLDSPLYVDRPPLEDLCYEVVRQPGSLLHLRGPQQTGKTSLMTRVVVQAKQADLVAVVLSIKLADQTVLQNLGQFLRWFCKAIDQLLDGDLSPVALWESSMGDSLGCTGYFQRRLEDLEVPLVLALDDLDELAKTPAIARDFFNMLHAWHEAARYGDERSAIWQQLRLVLVHSNLIYLSELATDLPLTLGTLVEMPPFTQQQVSDLAQRHDLDKADIIAQKLVQFLNGQPSLTQLALHHLKERKITLESITASYLSPDSIFAEHLLSHFSLLQQHPDLLASLRQVVQADQPVMIAPLQAFQLSRLGLIASQGQRAIPQCQLYRAYFSHVLYA